MIDQKRSDVELYTIKASCGLLSRRALAFSDSILDVQGVGVLLGATLNQLTMALPHICDLIHDIDARDMLDLCARTKYEA